MPVADSSIVRAELLHDAYRERARHTRGSQRAEKTPERDSEFVGTLLRRVVAEAKVDLGDDAPTDVLAVLTFETFSGNTGLTLFDVGTPRAVPLGLSTPFPYVGFVTTVVPGQGFGADLALHEGYAYVASGDAGLQVVNLTRARELFLATNPRPSLHSVHGPQEPLHSWTGIRANGHRCRREVRR